MLYGLTEREILTLLRLSVGVSTGQIATEEGITVDAVKYRLKQIMKKTSSNTRAEAVAKAVRGGLI